MAAGYEDSEKDRFVVAFGESDGGHAFVTLSDAINANSIKAVQPQDDVWGAIDSLRNGSAQIAVIPFSNKITSAEAATVAGLASGDLKILGQIQRRTNHVLVGLKHNIQRVDQAARDAGYGDAMMSSTTSGQQQDSPSGGPTAEAIKQFVFLLHVVHSSKSVFDQTRGKLTGSDFRSAITVEHTSNPMRVLLRDHRERKTMAIVDAMERKAGQPGARPGVSAMPQTGVMTGGGYQPISLGQPEVRHEKPIEHDFFSASLVAEGLLESANRVCQIGPGLKPNKLCSQRLSEMNEHLCELKTDAEAPLDLPNNVTTFLVVQAANAKLSDGLKKAFPWDDGSQRLAAQRAKLEQDIKACQFTLDKFDADIEATQAQMEATQDQVRKVAFSEQIDNLKSGKKAYDNELAKLRTAMGQLSEKVLGPKDVKPALRAAFLLSVEGQEADWSKLFKRFEEQMSKRFKHLDLKFDQSPELASHLGKNVLLVSARADGADPAKAAHYESEITKYFKKVKEHESKTETTLSAMADFAAGGPPKKFESKLLGIYPSWVVKGAHRDQWFADGKSEAAKPKKPPAINAFSVMMFVLFWIALIFLVTVTSTPYGQAWVMGILDTIMGYFRFLFFGPA
jgi:hypothetical protein